jgi:superfamily II DNA/RNA helicase
MRVDVNDPKIQVIIMANTRELIRQVADVIEVVSKKTGVTVCIGEKETKTFAHIMVTVPAWIANMSGGRSPLDFSSLKMCIFDEADEIF